jgi:solute carrier family 25 phosphate transporter 3
MMKFLVFDYFADFVFDLQPALAERVETQLLVSLISGAVAGVASSIISQPADSILTRMNQKEGRASFFSTALENWEDQGSSFAPMTRDEVFCSPFISTASPC